ncbi:MAG: ATP synthase F0 subunit B [Bdellovibrionota bacterium]
MSLLSQLGVNETFFIQFIIYICMFSFLSLYVFAPYAQALEKREEKTKGTEQVAEEYRNKYNEVNSAYQNKAKEVHSRIQEIYQTIRKEAAQEYDKIVDQAKQQVASLMDSNNLAIEKEVTQATVQLKTQSQDITSEIVKKVLGK